MPIYNFECTECNNKEEQIMTVSKYTEGNITCSKCGAPLKQIYEKMNFELKGMCWERDGYCGVDEAKGYK